ncbi:hypothetical protein TrVE_jg2948 [Triparma verrucosa]|uniref:Uncharacterized protein n=1 Tax=Triparma verrucosa TaxID=1606542 RepID=A0A9W7KWH4_9STRA|nr:hypothetical protein TrVE_jg2948 [Triparma verrucosa]
MSTIKVPSPEEVYRGTAPKLNPPSPHRAGGVVSIPSPGEGSGWSQPEPYLDILVTSSSNFTSKYSKIRHKPSFSSISNQPSSSASSEDYIFIPNLSHTGIVTSLVDPSSPIGVKVQSAVKGVYPQKEQKMLMDSKLLDLAKPVTTVTSHLPNTLNKKSYTSASPQKRNVVLTGTMTMEDPYLDHEGRVTKPTKVHELVYNKRMMMPHSRRKTRFAREILSTMKRDLEEAKLKIPV